MPHVQENSFIIIDRNKNNAGTTLLVYPNKHYYRVFVL